MSNSSSRILGISASLRNSRINNKTNQFCDEIKSILSEEQLIQYLKKQGSLLLDAFEKAGRADKLSYDEIYKTFLKHKTGNGLSNSEVALAAGLWGAYQEGSDISHIALSDFFPASGEARNLGVLRETIRSADAILLSGPVYFGDRGSLAHEFIEFLRCDEVCRAHVKNKLYAGISVGAKRNGGQETTLIYQMMDMCNINMLSLGNSSETTSQYGGTVVAGDIGMAADDTYGLKTSIGTGRRIAKVSQMMLAGGQKQIKDKVNISIWLLQDNHTERGLELVQNFCHDIESKMSRVQFTIYDFTEREVRRCIACDICPTHIDVSEKYRCIIKSKRDLFSVQHEELINQDAIILAAYSPTDTRSLKSVYQKFIERTRYLRRDHYVLGNVLTAPLVLSEVNANQNLHIRMLTSMIRHHTILHHPLLGFEYQQEIINWDFLIKQGISFVENTVQLTSGKLQMEASKVTDTLYNPLGYVYSAAEAKHEEKQARQARMFEKRKENFAKAKERIS